MDKLTVPGVLDSLKPLRDFVEDAARQIDLNQAAISRMKVAVDELATNTIHYGYQAAELAGDISVQVKILPGQMRVILEDSAAPFDPTQADVSHDPNMRLEDRRIGGMGLFFVRENIDEVRYARVGELNQTTLIINSPEIRVSQIVTEIPGRLVIFDTQQQARDSLYNQLHVRGYVLLQVDTSAQVKEMMELGNIDVIVVAVNAGENHIDLLLWLNNHRIGRDVPVIVVSADADYDLISQCLALPNVKDYLLEPFPDVLLLARIKATIQHQRTQSYLRHADKLARDVHQVILPVGVALAGEDDFDKLLERIVMEAQQVCAADGGTLYLRENNDLHFAIMRTASLGIALGGSTGHDIPFPPLKLRDEEGNPNEQNVATYVANHSEIVNLDDVYNASDFDFTATRSFDERNSYSTKSCLTVPLIRDKGDVIGVLQLINSGQFDGSFGAFDEYEQLVVEMLATQATVALNHKLMMRRQAQLLKFENDLQIGHDIQASFLPKAFPEINGWQIASRFQAAREVAGDFYDVVPMPSNRYGLVVADVADKGVGAALFMSLIRSLLRAFSSQNYSVDWGRMLDSGQVNMRRMKRLAVKRIMPSAGVLSLENAVHLTNNYVATIHRDLNMFATLFFGVIEPRSNAVFYINGGHNPPIHIDSQGNVKAKLEPTGPAVGMMDGIDFEMDQVELLEGDMLVMFTDGVTDAKNANDEFYTEERLIRMLENPPDSPEALIERILADLLGHIGNAVQFDDITLMIVQRTESTTTSKRANVLDKLADL